MRWEKRRQAFGRIKEWTKHTSWSKVTLFRCNSLSVAWEFKRWWEGRYLSTRTAETIRFVRYNSSGSPTSKLDKWTKKNQSDVTSIMTPQRNKEATDYPPLNKQNISTISISITITILAFFHFFFFLNLSFPLQFAAKPFVQARLRFQAGNGVGTKLERRCQRIIAGAIELCVP